MQIHKSNTKPAQIKLRLSKKRKLTDPSAPPPRTSKSYRLRVGTVKKIDTLRKVNELRSRTAVIEALVDMAYQEMVGR